MLEKLRFYKPAVLMISALLIMILAALPMVAAQETTVDESAATVLVTGPVEFVDGSIVVGGYIIAPAGAFLPPILVEGDIVIVIGILLPDGET
ncbi:hypothetical protein FBR02_15295, partial [Anaerolineae bacterium CFX9]|nr:hypothetical protein [Anaerolineae bacterium CFX9]